MPGKVIFNYNQYKYRLESENRLLLYHPRSGKIIMVHGKSRDQLLHIIESDEGMLVNLKDKYIRYFINNMILIVVDNNDRK